MSVKKQPRLRFNTASAFSRKFYQNGRVRRGRSKYEENTPGTLFKYISAGGFENTSHDYDNDRPRPRSPFPVYLTAVVLLAIWLIF